MADFSNIIQEINEEIKQNGANEITGAKLNEVLRDMIAAVNDEKQDPLTIDATPTEDSTNLVQSGGVYDALQDKANKVNGATNGNLAGFDSNGNLTDSGFSVFNFFVMVEDATTPPAIMAPNTIYRYGLLSGNTAFPPLQPSTDLTIANIYCWTFSTPSTAPTITWPSAITSWAGGSAPTINASKNYEVSVMDGLATIIEA